MANTEDVRAWLQLSRAELLLLNRGVTYGIGVGNGIAARSLKQKLAELVEASACASSIQIEVENAAVQEKPRRTGRALARTV